MCVMGDNILKDEAIIEFEKLVQNSHNLNKELDCYVQLMKEIIIRSYCEN